MTRGRGRPRAPEADAAIAAAALAEFAERGADGLSMEGVARRAGVAKLTVYRRFSTKQDLLVGAVALARSALPDFTAWQRSGTPLPELVADLLDRAAAALADPATARVLARLIGAGPGYPAVLAAVQEQIVAPQRAAVRLLVARAAAEGLVVADVDAEVAMDMVVGAVLYRLLVVPGPHEAAELRAYLESVLRRAGWRGA